MESAGIERASSNIERKALILKRLEKDGKVSVNEISDELRVCRETIRRDLREMEQEKMVQRIHGGAILSDNIQKVKEYPYLAREIQNYNEKLRICKVAAELVEDGDTIFIDNSSTTIKMLKNINPKYQVTVITNSIRLLLEATLLNNENPTIVSIGGIFRPKNYSLTGILANQWSKMFHPNKAFLSCYGVHTEYGLYDSNIHEIEVKRIMLELSQSTYIMADHTKIDRSGVVYLNDFSNVNGIITDEPLTKEQESCIEKNNIELIIAK